MSTRFATTFGARSICCADRGAGQPATVRRDALRFRGATPPRAARLLRGAASSSPRGLADRGQQVAAKARGCRQHAAHHRAGDAARDDVLTREIEAANRRRRLQEALPEALGGVLDAVDLAVPVIAEMLRRQRRPEFVAIDLAAQLRQMRVEPLEHPLSQPFLERLVLVAALHPARALPAFEPA